MNASEENPGESLKPKVLLKLKCNQERPQDEAFLRALVRVQMCTRGGGCTHALLPKRSSLLLVFM